MRSPRRRPDPPGPGRRPDAPGRMDLSPWGVRTRSIDTRAPVGAVDVTAPTPAPAGRTFVLVHGYGCSSYMWRHWLAGLAGRGRVVLVDMKGFGAAPKPDDDRYSPRDLAEAVVELIRELGLRRVTLVGQSLGGGVALLTALALHDEGEGRLERMVLLAPAAYRQKLPPFVWLSHRPRLTSALLKALGPRRVIGWVLDSIVHDPETLPDDPVPEYARAWETPDGVRAALAVGRRIVPDDLDRLSERYGEIAVPTLLLWGDDDRVVPLWVGRRLAREMADARLVVLEGCGHMATDELPEASWEVVEGFLDGVSAPR